MPTTYTYTVETDGSGSYSQMQGALNAAYTAHPDLVSDDAIIEIVCTKGSVDTNDVNVPPFTTSITQYIDVHAAVGSEAQMPFASAANAYTLRRTLSGHCVRIQGADPEMNIYFRGLQFLMSGYTGTSAHFAFKLDGVTSTCRVQIENCYIQKTSTSTAGDAGGIYTYDSQYIVTIINTIIDGFEDHTAQFGVRGRQGNITALNCLVVNCSVGYKQDAGTFLTKNCAGDNTTTAFSGTFSGSSVNNAYDSGSDPGSSGVSGGGTYVNEGSGDFHIDGGLYASAGVDLTSDFTDDFDGDIRSNWAIGPDEDEGGQSIIPLIMQQM